MRLVFGASDTGQFTSIGRESPVPTVGLTWQKTQLPAVPKLLSQSGWKGVSYCFHRRKRACQLSLLPSPGRRLRCSSKAADAVRGGRQADIS